MRQLRGHEYAALAARRHRPLPLQRVRTLLQDERTEQTAHQAQAKTGECKNPTNFMSFTNYLNLGRSLCFNYLHLITLLYTQNKNQRLTFKYFN